MPKPPFIDAHFKYCPNCDAVKKLSEFTKVAKKPRGASSWCKACMAAYRRMRRSTVGTADFKRLQQARKKHTK